MLYSLKLLVYGHSQKILHLLYNKWFSGILADTFNNLFGEVLYRHRIFCINIIISQTYLYPYCH